MTPYFNSVNTYFLSEIVTPEVVCAFVPLVGLDAAMEEAGRAVSGLLKKADERGEIIAERYCGMALMAYQMKDFQLDEIRAEAIYKAATADSIAA